MNNRPLLLAYTTAVALVAQRLAARPRAEVVAGYTVRDHAAVPGVPARLSLRPGGTCHRSVTDGALGHPRIDAW